MNKKRDMHRAEHNSWLTLKQFTLRDIAICCRVTMLTARRWILSGKLKTLPKQYHNSKLIVPRSELEAFCGGRIPMPTDKTLMEVSYELELTHDLVHYYVQRGDIFAVRFGGTGDYRIPLAAIRLFLYNKKNVDIFRPRTIKEILGENYDQI